MKKLALFLIGMGCLATVSVSASNYSSAMQQLQSQEEPCTQVPCNPAPCQPDTVCNPAPCNPAPCNPGC